MTRFVPKQHTLRFIFFWLCYGLLALGSGMAWALTGNGEGPPSEVRLPLADYTRLLEQSQEEKQIAPAAYALGQGRATVTVSEQDDEQLVARVSLGFEVKIHEQKWTKVPLLEQPTALHYAKVDGEAVQLMLDGAGLSWVSREPGTYHLALEYQVLANRQGKGWHLPLKLPEMAATELSLDLPEPNLSVTVTPAEGLETHSDGEHTEVLAQLPRSKDIHITWQRAGLRDYALSRARYRGEWLDDALRWTAQFEVELFGAEPLLLPLFPASVTLTDLQVDGKAATVLVVDDKEPRKARPVKQKIRPPQPTPAYFAARLHGMGKHQLSLTFETPIEQGSGPPRTAFAIPPLPISRFELNLPGRKEITATPASNVANSYSGAGDEAMTQAVLHIPLSEQVEFSWAEAIPDDVQDELRANASLYHAVHAEEGVLHGRAFIEYDITRGETNVLNLEVPPDVQINRIIAKEGGVSDWRASQSDAQQPQQISVFLDRQVKRQFQFTVYYERLLGAAPDAAEAIPVPLLRASGVHRQRGMLALLSGPELALRPQQAEGVSKVGENQLPGFVRNALKMTVAHTYKYIDPNPQVIAQAVAPERKAGKFDVQVDTLLSIGDVTLKGSASLDLNVKSGSLMALNLRLPDNVNLLGLSSPSMRTYQVKPEDGGQTVQLEFTQEMEGQFRIELSYERILAETGNETDVPGVAVPDAEVEYGRIAVEALAAVEVQATKLENLSTLDLNELPQQLVLKTTNPILLAYRYVHPPYQLGLKITRHKELAVQVASIEQANYYTLITRDGLAVTTARYTVRNSRKQFLRLTLPQGAEVWSVFVGGKGEKPAQADDGRGVLIRMMNDTNGFPLEIVYALQTDKIAYRGALHTQLPRPDILVTRSRWDLYLPTGPIYSSAPESNMDLVLSDARADQSTMSKYLSRNQNASRQPQRSLQLRVPTQGVHYAFEKLYANKSTEDAYVRLGYISAAARDLGSWLSLLGVILFGFGLLVVGKQIAAVPAVAGPLAAVAGLLLMAYARWALAADFSNALLTAFLFLLLLGLLRVRRYWKKRA